MTVFVSDEPEFRVNHRTHLKNIEGAITDIEKALVIAPENWKRRNEARAKLRDLKKDGE